MEWWDNFSGESVKGQLSVLHLGGDWLILPQALPYKCLALPGPCAVTPARMPQARPCRPMRSGRQGERRRCRHAWPHTPPSRLAGGLGPPGSVGVCLGVGPGAEAVERDVRGERRPWREASVERGVCSEAAPGSLKNKEAEGPSSSSAHYLCPSIGAEPEGHSHWPPQCTAWL